MTDHFPDTKKMVPTPSPELVNAWSETIYRETEDDDQRDLFIATRAAQWGYDQYEQALLNAMHAIVPPPDDSMKPKKQLFEIDPHPAIPPSDQLKEWEDQWFDEEEHADVLLIKAFQAGADQELEACCEWVSSFSNKFIHAHDLRLVRRPKPPSLKDRLTVALQNEDIGTALRLVEQIDD